MNAFNAHDRQENRLAAAAGCILFPIPLIVCADSPFARHCANQGLLAAIVYALTALVFDVILLITGWIPLVGALIKFSGWVAKAAAAVLALMNAWQAWNGQTPCLPYIGSIKIIR